MLSSSTHCAKHKKRANNICGTQKCFTNNFYQNAGMTRCPYYLHEDCGHNGKLRAVKGIKIRKTLMIFNLGIYVPIYVGLFLFFILMDLFRQTNYMADSHEAIPILPFMVLIPNLVSVLFMGRVVAVCNKQGIYTNDPLVTWNEIAELRYTALVPSRHNYTMSYLEIIKKDQSICQVPYMTLLIFIVAKHYDKNVRIRFSKSCIISKCIAYGIAIVGAIVLVGVCR